MSFQAHKCDSEDNDIATTHVALTCHLQEQVEIVFRLSGAIMRIIPLVPPLDENREGPLVTPKKTKVPCRFINWNTHLASVLSCTQVYNSVSDRFLMIATSKHLPLIG